MNKTVFSTVTATMIILAASCGQRQPKTIVEETAGTSLADTPQPQQTKKMDEAAFSELLLEIIYQLPASVMPNYLKTKEQRRNVVTEYTNNDNYVNPTTFSHYQHYDGGYDAWNMAAYLTEDNRNIVLIVQYGSGLDGFLLKSDKTLNYNIETQEFTEIERPIEMPTVDEMIVETNFNNQPFYQKAKAFFSKKMKFHYRDFNSEGFIVYLDVWDFYEKNNSVYDKYVIGTMVACYKWNGKQFCKDKIINGEDYQ